MKFFATVLMTVFMLAGGVAYANNLAPVVDGNDVLFPDELIQTIPGATADNVWCRFHDKKPTWVKMTKEGNVWRAPGARGHDVHPYVGDISPAEYDPTKYSVKLENLYHLYGSDKDPWIIFRGENPSVNVQ